MGSEAMQADWAPLAGFEILDISRRVAGPLAARLLGDLGAHVRRLEPLEGDPLLGIDDRPASASRCAYDQVNAGKATESVRDLAAAVEGAAGRDRRAAVRPHTR